MKIKISSLNTKSETQNEMQHVLQKYTSHTCHESAQNGAVVVCFHPCINDYNMWGENTKDNTWKCASKWNTQEIVVMFVVVTNLTILTFVDYILATNSLISCNEGVTF